MWEKIKSDIRNFDLNNEDERVVLNANYFSAYRRIPVLRTFGTRSGYFGVMFITRETNRRRNPEDIVRHEYGHSKQMKVLGPLRFGFCIGIPSRFKWGEESYYDKPWEVIADVRGGVLSRRPSAETVRRGEEYLEASRREGIRVWRRIKKKF